MSAPNLSRSYPTFFTLVGIPGMEKCHTWISIPVCMMYSAALLGNSVLLVTIVKERSLHEPMYIFLCMLAVCDLLLSTATVPKTLSILWSLSTQISFSGCLAQMFSIYFIFVAESAILLAMAFDWYMAICDPLRYTAVLTCSVVVKVGVAALIRSFCIMFPAIFLLKRLPYCGHNVMPHTYCEHIGVARLACADISVNIWYGVAAGFLSAGLDAISIAISYVLIFRRLWGLPSPRASPKALHTCGSHLCVIAMFYTPAFFSFLGHQFGQHVPRHVLIFLANLYVMVPPMLNPIIYGVRTRQIREHVAHLLRLGGLGWQGMAGQAGTGNQDGLLARGVKRSFEKREMNERQQGPGKHGPDGNVFKISVFNGHQHPTHSSVAERLDRFPDVLMGNNPLGP